MPGFTDFLAGQAGFVYKDRSSAWAARCCIRCGHDITGRVRTELEAREYAISALCGVCWDEIFKEAE